MRRSMVGGLAAALVALGLVGAPATAAPSKPPKAISHSVDAGPGSFDEEAISSFGLNVIRTGLLRCPSSVAWTITDVTATNGSDFSAGSSGTLTFAKGETSKGVSVSILQDANPEGPETFTFTLSSPTTSCKGGILSTVGTGSPATVTITDMDPTVFSVPAGGSISVNGILGGCSDLSARLHTPFQEFTMATDNNGCSTSIPISNFTWGNTGTSAAVVRISLVDFFCNTDRYFHDFTGFSNANQAPTTVNHARVTPKTGGGWDVDINDGAASNVLCTSDNVPSAVDTGNLSVDVSITQPS